MINSVTMVGRIGREIEVKQSQNGKSYGEFTIALTRNFTNQNGERETDWVNIRAFGKTAEIVRDYFRKGSRIGIQGEYRADRYQADNGEPRTYHYIAASSVAFIDTKAETEGMAVNQATQTYTANQTSSFKSFETNPDQERFTRSQSADEIGITDDDLPF